MKKHYKTSKKLNFWNISIVCVFILKKDKKNFKRKNLFCFGWNIQAIRKICCDEFCIGCAKKEIDATKK